MMQVITQLLCYVETNDDRQASKLYRRDEMNVCHRLMIPDKQLYAKPMEKIFHSVNT